MHCLIHFPFVFFSFFLETWGLFKESESVSFQINAKGSRACNEGTYGQRTFESFGCGCESFCCIMLQSYFNNNGTNFFIRWWTNEGTYPFTCLMFLFPKGLRIYLVHDCNCIVLCIRQDTLNWLCFQFS